MAELQFEGQSESTLDEVAASRQLNLLARQPLAGTCNGLIIHQPGELRRRPRGSRQAGKVDQIVELVCDFVALLLVLVCGGGGRRVVVVQNGQLLFGQNCRTLRQFRVLKKKQQDQ